MSFRPFQRLRLGLATLGAAVLASLASGQASLKIEGEGYFRLLHEGRAVYAKRVSVAVKDGELKEASGLSFLPPIRLSDAKFSVDVEGWVTVRGSKVARFMLARFASEPQPEGNFLIARDRPEFGFAGKEGFGTVVSGAASPSAPPASQLDARPSTSAAGGATRISIDEKAEVEGTRITLGEIARIEGPGAERLRSLDLGNAPVHGVPLPYTRDRIVAKIALLGFDSKNSELAMGATVEIRRAGQIVTPDQFLAAARSAVEAKLGLKADLDCPDKQAELRVPNGAVELVAESVTTADGAVTVTLGVKVDGRRIVGRTVRLVGPALAYAVQAGATVNVRFVSNGVAIEMTGRARQSGVVGQTIEITVQPGTGSVPTTHQGTIQASGLVEVRL
jgi:hypothetical protein